MQKCIEIVRLAHIASAYAKSDFAFLEWFFKLGLAAVFLMTSLEGLF